jgi:hypothetical protein
MGFIGIIWSWPQRLGREECVGIGRTWLLILAIAQVSGQSFGAE